MALVGATALRGISVTDFLLGYLEHRARWGLLIAAISLGALASCSNLHQWVEYAEPGQRSVRFGSARVEKEAEAHCDRRLNN